ncbi:hypothetical protein GCM10023341_10440 [Ornithinimicrobium tianjinense]
MAPAVASSVTAALVLAFSAWDGQLVLDAPAGQAPDTAVATASGSALVGAAALGCPGPELLGVDGDEQREQQVTVTAAAAPRRVVRAAESPSDAAGADIEAKAELSATGGAGDAPVDLVGGAGSLTLDTAAGALVLASGPAAPGLVAGQLGQSTAAGTRGLSLTACSAPAETLWLVGGGASPGRTEHLVLTNPGDDAVTVDVAVWGAEGPAARTGTDEIVVPARGRTVHLLDALAPSVESPVLRVRSRGGPVTAYLGEDYRERTVDLGAEVVTASAPPSTDLVVPSVDADGPERLPGRTMTLRLAAPGDAAAVVDVTALTERGAVTLPGAVTRVPAGRTVDVALGDLPEGVLGLRLRSDVPVTAGARLEVPPTGDEPLPPDEAGASEEPEDGDSPGSRGDDTSSTSGADGGASADPDGPPILRPAGETAWVAATTPSLTPLGMAVPATDGVPGARAGLVVTVVDAADVVVHTLAADGTVRQEELGRVPNDTSRAVDLRADTRAVWVSVTGGVGVVASVLLSGADRRGPYLAASTVPGTPWSRPVADVTVLGP